MFCAPNAKYLTEVSQNPTPKNPVRRKEALLTEFRKTSVQCEVGGEK